MIGGERRSRRGADLDATSLHGANLVVVGIASARVAGGRVAERRRASRVTSGGVASCRERFLHDVARRSGRRVVPRARRGRTRASRRRVGFGRVARARTLDARALSTRELRLRRAKLRLERGALPRARPARAKPLGRRRHVARWPDARRDLRERYRRFACPPTTGVGARASTVQEIDLLTGALIHGLVNSRQERMRFWSESSCSNPKQTVKISQFRRCPGFYPQRQTNRNPAFQCALCTKVTTALRGFIARRARGLVARGVIHARPAIDGVSGGTAVVERVRRGSTGERTAYTGLLSRKRNCRVARFPRVPEISPSRKSSSPGSRREPRGAGRSTRARG